MALPLIVHWLDEDSDFADQDAAAFQALGQADPTGKAVARYLKHVLNSGSPNRRVGAIEAARGAVWNTNALAEPLRETLAGPDRYLAMNAAGILVSLDDHGEQAITVLIDCLDDGIAQNRAYAAHLLAEIGPKAAAAAPA